MQRASRRPVLVALFAISIAGILAAPADVAVARQPLSRAPAGADRVSVPHQAVTKLSPTLTHAAGRVSVFVQLATRSAADAFSAALTTAQGQKAAKAATAAANRSANLVFSAVRQTDRGARELFRTHNAVAGVAIRASVAQIRKLAKRPDVRSIALLTPKQVENAHAEQLTRVLKVWQDLGILGDSVRIGIIDTGIDYTHADFGGPGTVAAFKSIDPTGPTPLFPTAKVVGGTDLAGENYNADSTDPAQYVPVPDGNPLDCAEHGSHVAGTAAGYGVNSDGSTFGGDYTALDETALDNMRIGPGMAPHAQLYAIKVFGCVGSTNLVAPAIDWALDPDQDGDFSDHLDVINMSLGGDYASPDDPENLFVAKAAQMGLLSVISMGNGGDLYDIGGSPGNSPEALTVASTRDNYELLDAAEVTAPGDVAGNKPGQYSVALDYDGVDVTRPVVQMTDTTNLDGCGPFNATDSAAVAGKFVWLEWDDNDASRRCGSAGRSANAVAAGADGAVFTSTLDHFAAGITGSATVPVFQLTGSATAALRPSAEAGTLTIRLAGDLRQTFNSIDPSIQDTPSSFTSRGTRRLAIKPDIAAPGDTIVSAAMGTGNQAVSFSGTSMASPHVAGIAALVMQAHPDWSPAEVKAALMNTATHDIYSMDGPSGPIEAPNRVGAGRVDARAALGNVVLAAVSSSDSKVGVSFAAPEVNAAHMTLTRTVKIVNKGTSPVAYDVSYDPITEMPGVSYSLSASHVSLTPKGVAKITVSLHLDRSAMRKVADPTVAKLQSFFGIADLPRQFLGDASGRVVFSPTSGSTWTLRLPVYSAPKPTSNIQVPKNLAVPSGNGTTFLGLGGRGLDQGSGDEAYLSLYSVMELGATSPRLPNCGVTGVTGCAINTTAKGGDLRYVGAGTTAPQENAGGDPSNAEMYFGIATWENWYNIGVNTIPFVDIDVTGDGAPDFETYVWRQTGTDLLWAETDDLNTGDNVDLEPINGQFGDVDTNTFDTNVLVMPVFLSTLGIDPTAASARLTYQVGVAGYYRAPADVLIDSTGPVSYDPLAPGLWAEGSAPSVIYVADPGTGLDIHRNAASVILDHNRKLLTLNLHNRDDQRATVTKVSVGAP